MMIRGYVEIDQSPCRACYGLKSADALRQEMYSERKAKVMDQIGAIAAAGDRMMRIETKENAIVNIGQEALYTEKPDIEYGYIESPRFRYRERTGALVNIFA